jgi:hypothetical protein
VRRQFKSAETRAGRGTTVSEEPPICGPGGDTCRSCSKIRSCRPSPRPPAAKGVKRRPWRKVKGRILTTLLLANRLWGWPDSTRLNSADSPLQCTASASPSSAPGAAPADALAKRSWGFPLINPARRGKVPRRAPAPTPHCVRQSRPSKRHGIAVDVIVLRCFSPRRARVDPYGTAIKHPSRTLMRTR